MQERRTECGQRGNGEMLYSGECRQTFRGMSQHSRECPQAFSVCNFQSTKSPVELNNLLSKCISPDQARPWTTCKRGIYVKPYCTCETIAERIKNYKLFSGMSLAGVSWNGSGSVAKHSRECRQTFRRVYSSILEGMYIAQGNRSISPRFHGICSTEPNAFY